MALRDIITIPDPLLREASREVEDITPELKALLADMAETMYDAPGIGLAGIQIAFPWRVTVVDVGDPDEETEYQAMLDAWEEEVANAEEKGEEPPARPKRPERKKNPIFLINPKVVAFSDAPSIYDEGCLSIPEYYAEVERPAGCTVEYIDIDGKKQTIEAIGLLSTCLQHEIDHLDGKLFIDYISRLKRDRVIKKFTKIAKQSGKDNASPLVL